MALNDHECGSSDFVCVQHFNSGDYTVSKNGKKYTLNTCAVPTLFDICLIEVSDDFDDNVDRNVSAKGNDSKVIQQDDGLKLMLRKERMILNSRMKYLTKAKKNQRKEITSLKKQVTYFRDKVNKLNKTITDIREGRCLPKEFEVIIFILKYLLFIMYAKWICFIFHMIRTTHTRKSLVVLSMELKLEKNIQKDCDNFS